jgi:hypothetical protein
VCDQLIDGDNAFGFLYNKHEGVNGIEQTLKPMCCGNSTSTNYVAGVHFPTKMIGTKSHKEGGFRHFSINQEGNGNLTQVGREGGQPGKESSGFGVH